MNWMYSIVFLFGLVLGAEVMWCIMKYHRNLIDHPADSRRPCEADGDKAYFHEWANYDQRTYALIEYHDGSIAQVIPEYIKFTDN